MVAHSVATSKNDEAAFKAAAALVSGKDVLAIAVCPRGDDDKPPEILLVVSKVSLDLDGYGRKFILWQDSQLQLSHYTPQRLETAIEEEAGCWLISGKVLFSKTVHDPADVLTVLRKTVNSVPYDKRMALLGRTIDEARAFPLMILNRGPSMTSATQRTLLRDVPALARALFLLNGQPPRCEGTLLDDLLGLDRFPPGIEGIPEILRGLDRYDLKRFEAARKKYEAIMRGLEAMSGLKR